MKTKRNKLKKFLLIVCIFIVIMFASCLFVVNYFYNKYSLDIDQLTSLNNGIKVYSANGTENTLYNTNRSIVEIETLPDYVKQAFISVEDKRFYSHNGYDIIRIFKAGFVNLASKSKSQGASTISQQLIKNALLSNEKTYSRKIQEIVLATKMEKIFTKEQILEMYLNTIYFGSNAYGLENASFTYFNKSAKDLTLNEACCLAGLIKSPNYYSPKKNLNAAIKRKNLVANLMFESGSITNEELKAVENEGISVSNNFSVDHSYEEEAIFEACRLLNISERELINRNYQIITFKDDSLQKEIINISNEIISANEDSTNTDLDSLSVVANNRGNVIAYYANSNFDLHNLTRQAASTLKPFAVYIPALTHNILNTTTHILDEEINYNGFSPKNADNIFHGYVTAKYALAHSLNIPAVKLLDSIGINTAKESLERFGINISNSDLNLSLALGSTKNGVKVLNLLSAYSTLANMGTYRQLCFVDKILDKNGEIIYSYEDFSEHIVKESDCYLINDMLKEAAKSGTAKRLSSLEIPIASKTGTAGSSNGDTDLYNIAYTSEHTMLTWIADIDKVFLPNNMLSSSQPTEINKSICDILYKSHKPADFTKPEDVVKAPYSLIELENNHIVVSPDENELERYVGYEYFKQENLPKKNINTKPVNLNLTISNAGVLLNFKAEKNKEYYLYRVIDNNTHLLNKIAETNEDVHLIDYNIFKYNEIAYYIADKNGLAISETFTVRPKDYLINLLDNELKSTKKKWSV